jgi:hypothetical protein
MDGSISANLFFEMGANQSGGRDILAGGLLCVRRRWKSSVMGRAAT